MLLTDTAMVHETSIYNYDQPFSNVLPTTTIKNGSSEELRISIVILLEPFAII